MIQYAAVHLVINEPKRVTPLFIELHWLPTCIKFKSLMLAYRLIDVTPCYAAISSGTATTLHKTIWTILVWWNGLLSARRGLIPLYLQEALEDPHALNIQYGHHFLQGI